MGSIALEPISFSFAAAFCATGSVGPVEDLISVTSRSARKLVKKLIHPAIGAITRECLAACQRVPRLGHPRGTDPPVSRFEMRADRPVRIMPQGPRALRP